MVRYFCDACRCETDRNNGRDVSWVVGREVTEKYLCLPCLSAVDKKVKEILK